MLRSLSVNLKGIIAIGILTLVAVGAAAISFMNSQSVIRSAEVASIAEERVQTIDNLEEQLARQAKAIVSFLMTGDRAWVTEYEKEIPTIRREFDQLIAIGGETAAPLEAAKATWENWHTQFISRQLDLMRQPQTVDMARALEASGQGSAMFDTMLASIGEAAQLLLDQRAQLVAEEKSALGTVEMTAIAATVITLVFAALIAWLNYTLVSAPLTRLAGVTQRLADGDLDVELDAAGRGDEIGRMTEALVIFRNKLMENRALEKATEEQRKEAERQRKEMLDMVAADFEATIVAIANEISGASNHMKSAADNLSHIASDTTRQAIDASAASEQATHNVESVASATEELSASIREINQQINTSARAATEATSHVEKSKSAVNELQGVVGRIGDVTKLINDIAEQTNLLALNATIEAARAGEAGRGFAVVAAEVKQLAEQTSKATEEIEQQIEEMLTAADVSTSTTQALAEMVRRISEGTTAMAASAEEQSAATDEIARHINEAAVGNQNVTRVIGDVSHAASETNELSGSMKNSADVLYERSARLREAAASFLEKVRAA